MRCVVEAAERVGDSRADLVGSVQAAGCLARRTLLKSIPASRRTAEIRRGRGRSPEPVENIDAGKALGTVS